MWRKQHSRPALETNSPLQVRKFKNIQGPPRMYKIQGGGINFTPTGPPKGCLQPELHRAAHQAVCCCFMFSVIMERHRSGTLPTFRTRGCCSYLLRVSKKDQRHPDPL
ncbi:unnamed protein product [Ectocarpus fasciculatus]